MMFGKDSENSIAEKIVSREFFIKKNLFEIHVESPWKTAGNEVK